jgi:hypothetical protein
MVWVATDLSWHYQIIPLGIREKIFYTANQCHPV